MSPITRRKLLGAGAVLAAGAALPAALARSRTPLPDSYEKMDAVAMAEAVKRGQASPAELLQEALQRLDRWNPVLNAVVIDHRELAQQAVAEGVEGPLRGVPFLIKDLGTYMKGTVTSEGSRFFKDAVAEHDSDVVASYRRAGLVILGKTNSPELGKSPVTENLLWGDTRNPWNPDYTPGGSSGGSAAAIAAGIVPLAHGNDGGGSLRMPASCCGLFGLKPSRFRVPLGPGRGDGSGMSTQHGISRSVRDSALLLDISHGWEPGGYGDIPRPRRPFLEEVDRAPGRLRVALMRQPAIAVPVDEECTEAAERAAQLCEELGHRVEEVTLPIDGMAAYSAAGTLLSLSSNTAIQARERALGREITEADLEPLNWHYYQQSRGVSADQLNAARAQQVAVHRKLSVFMQDYDVILSPTLPEVPVRIGEIGPRQPVEVFEQRAGTYSLFTLLYNFTGQPAMSVPLHWSQEGLPVGVQFAGRYGEEALLLRLAGQLERARPWFERRPTFPGDAR